LRPSPLAPRACAWSTVGSSAFSVTSKKEPAVVLVSGSRSRSTFTSLSFQRQPWSAPLPPPIAPAEAGRNSPTRTVVPDWSPAHANPAATQRQIDLSPSALIALPFNGHPWPVATSDASTVIIHLVNVCTPVCPSAPTAANSNSPTPRPCATGSASAWFRGGFNFSFTPSPCATCGVNRIAGSASVQLLSRNSTRSIPPNLPLPPPRLATQPHAPPTPPPNFQFFLPPILNLRS